MCAQDEETLKRAHNEVPTDDELNCRLARSPAELATFRAIDAEMDAVSHPMGKPLDWVVCSKPFHLYSMLIKLLPFGYHLCECHLSRALRLPLG